MGVHKLLATIRDILVELGGVRQKSMILKFRFYTTLVGLVFYMSWGENYRFRIILCWEVKWEITRVFFLTQSRSCGDAGNHEAGRQQSWLHVQQTHFLSYSRQWNIILILRNHSLREQIRGVPKNSPCQYSSPDVSASIVVGCYTSAIYSHFWRTKI